MTFCMKKWHDLEDFQVSRYLKIVTASYYITLYQFYFSFRKFSRVLLYHNTNAFLSPESITGTFESSTCGIDELLFFKNASKFRKNQKIQKLAISGPVLYLKPSETHFIYLLGTRLCDVFKTLFEVIEILRMLAGPSGSRAIADHGTKTGCGSQFWVILPYFGIKIT